MPARTASLRTEVCIGLSLALVAGGALAHVLIAPTASEMGKQETYTLTVPTEGASATTGVELEVPSEVTVVSVSAPAADYTLTRDEGRIIGITWHVHIPPGDEKQLVFVAQNPQGPTRTIRWKVHQLFADGTRADWVDPPPSRPAPSTRLSGK